MASPWAQRPFDTSAFGGRLRGAERGGSPVPSPALARSRCCLSFRTKRGISLPAQMVRPIMNGLALGTETLRHVRLRRAAQGGRAWRVPRPFARSCAIPLLSLIPNEARNLSARSDGPSHHEWPRPGHRDPSTRPPSAGGSGGQSVEGPPSLRPLLRDPAAVSHSERSEESLCPLRWSVPS